MSGTVVRIDTTELKRLRSGLILAGASYKRAESIQAQTFNRAGQRLTTDITKKLRVWTGIRRRKAIADRVRRVIARPGMLTVGMRVRSPYLHLTRDDFGAAWQRSWPGARHSAWGRAVTANGTFMAFRGIEGKYAGGLVFKRIGKGRLPIRPLYGPNVAREMERNAPAVTAVLAREAKWISTEQIRRADVELKNAKRRYGL